jgi:hypothetical protein
MNVTEVLRIIDELKGIIKVKLSPGEICPCCGHKKGSRKVSEKMLEANRRNIKLAQDKIRKK